MPHTAPSSEAFRVSDAAVVARYLQLRSFINDRLLARVENLALDRYHLSPTRRLASTLTAHVRTGLQRTDGGEIWPVFFLTAVDISAALCTQMTPEWLASLGTTIKGPQRLRHRLWEDWWGWEKNLASLHPTFFDLPPAEQEDHLVAFYRESLEWLAHNKVMARK